MSSAQQGGGLSASDWRALIAQNPLYFEVISDSMRPAFQRGDRVCIRPLQDGEPQPGQILAFYRGMLITHRYRGNGRCQGDNTLAVERAIGREEMVGIVTAVRRDGRDFPLPRVSRVQMAIRRLRLRIALLSRAAVGLTKRNKALTRH